MISELIAHLLKLTKQIQQLKMLITESPLNLLGMFI